MNDAFGVGFEDQVRERLIRSGRVADGRSFDELWLELRRYLMLQLVLRKLPPAANEVDGIWQEWMENAKPYQQFCERFAGRMIPRQPPSEQTDQLSERALYEWVYAHSYDVLPSSERIWQFEQSPFELGMLLVMRLEEAIQLQERYFDSRSAFPLYRCSTPANRVGITCLVK